VVRPALFSDLFSPAGRGGEGRRGSVWELWLLVVLLFFFMGASLAGRGGRGRGLLEVLVVRLVSGCGCRAGDGGRAVEFLSLGRFSATARLAPASTCDLGVLFLCRWSSSGSSSLSPAGGGAELVVPLCSSSPSCWYGETESDDFPSAWSSLELSTLLAPGGSGSGEAAARPCSASEVEDEGSSRDLIVISGLFGGVLYYRV
jgi:hypothetical protein